MQVEADKQCSKLEQEYKSHHSAKLEQLKSRLAGKRSNQNQENLLKAQEHAERLAALQKALNTKRFAFVAKNARSLNSSLVSEVARLQRESEANIDALKSSADAAIEQRRQLHTRIQMRKKAGTAGTKQFSDHEPKQHDADEGDDDDDALYHSDEERESVSTVFPEEEPQQYNNANIDLKRQPTQLVSTLESNVSQGVLVRSNTASPTNLSSSARSATVYPAVNNSSAIARSPTLSSSTSNIPGRSYTIASPAARSATISASPEIAVEDSSSDFTDAGISSPTALKGTLQSPMSVPARTPTSFNADLQRNTILPRSSTLADSTSVAAEFVPTRQQTIVLGDRVLTEAERAYLIKRASLDDENDSQEDEDPGNSSPPQSMDPNYSSLNQSKTSEPVVGGGLKRLAAAGVPSAAEDLARRSKLSHIPQIAATSEDNFVLKLARKRRADALKWQREHLQDMSATNHNKLQKILGELTVGHVAELAALPSVSDLTERTLRTVLLLLGSLLVALCFCSSFYSILLF